MASKPRSNFYFWQVKNRPKYHPFKKDKNLAEIIGVILGDGNIEAFPRTERLTIACNSKNSGFIKRYKKLIEKVFNKKTRCAKIKNKNCTRISIYEKYISKRLEVPTGNRRQLKIEVPKWILKDREALISYLRGLYEAEGSFCIHQPTSTYKLLFSNSNPSILNIVYHGLQKLGFHPHRSRYKIQLSKKDEVYKCKNLIGFRKY